jgi:hypothetical protein
MFQNPFTHRLAMDIWTLKMMATSAFARVDSGPKKYF